MALQPMVRSFLAPALLAAVSLACLPAHAEGEAAPAKKVVNLNQASAAEIARLPRVGEKLAQRIVDHRQKNGPFKRTEDLMEVKGVGEKMYKQLQPYLAVAGSTTLTAKVSSAGARGGSRGSKRGPGKEGGR